MLRPKANVPPNTTQNLMRGAHILTTLPVVLSLGVSFVLNLSFIGNSAQTIRQDSEAMVGGASRVLSSI